MTPSAPNAVRVSETLADKTLVVVGATGFLGKVWLAMLLHRYPEIGHIFLLVRAKKDLDPTARFWAEVATSHVFDPHREAMGQKPFEDFLRAKITPVGGDVANTLLGIEPALLDRMKGADAVVNAAGVVDFNPPLDEALNVNAFGVQNLIALARHLGDVPILHTSTCYVVGNRDDMVLERDPREFPFPRADELEPSLWNAEDEIQECIDLVAQARSRCDDRFRQSHFLDVAKRNLEKANEPTQGSALDDELAKVRRKFIEKQLSRAGIERAEFWGWANIYTYTKSIGEQVLLSSGLRTTIVRPAVIESAVAFPFEGWCEGINTSGPLIYMAMQGQIGYAASDKVSLDIVPVDMVSAGMIAALVMLLRNEHQPVYQLGSSDVNACPVPRLVELTGLAKRKRFQNKKTTLVNFIQAHIEPISLREDQFYRQGAPAVAKAAEGVAGLLGKLKKTPVRAIAGPAQKLVSGYAKQAGKIAEIMELYVPFTIKNEFRFSCKNTRNMFARLTEEDRELLPWHPETIDWRHYLIEVHIPGLVKWCDPLIDEKLNRELEPKRRHDNLVALVEDMANRHEHSVAYQQLTDDDVFTRITFLDVWARAGAVAARLAERGVIKGDRVALAGKNAPEWPIAYFGILRAGATAVPFDPAMESDAIANILKSSEAKVAIFDDSVDAPDFTAIEKLETFTDSDTALTPPIVENYGSDLASLIYTSGTTGTPKGVMLTHENFTSLLASLSPLFNIGARDRILSVLPLHHTFEFTCGMLLPLAHGSRVIYLDELSGERLVTALTNGRVTAMVGVPALWQLLERRILAQVKERGPVAEAAFKLMLKVNRDMGRRFGMDVGKAFFRQVHNGLGGNLRLLISGGAALPSSTQETFSGLGLHLAEGYGLTEAAPVLTVSKPKPGNKIGQVGVAIPGVEIRIDNPNADGVGEVLARGPNVMKGYVGDEKATREVLQDGWLRTGDLGKLDKKDRLTIVGRSKDVIVSSTGENVYPDDIEETLGEIDNIKEISIVGVTDHRGGERVACLAVPDADHKIAMDSLQAAFSKLPRHLRPTVTHLWDYDLPRTATRKVKRNEVRKTLERLRAATDAATDRTVPVSDSVTAAIAAVADMKPEDVKGSDHLANDLGFDSLQVVELSAALDIAAEELAEVTTVAEVAALMKKRRTSKPKVENNAIDADDEVKIPSIVKRLGKAALTIGQRRLYSDVMKTKVTGQANIPYNRNTIVVANHTSHLDMGLVKHALGSYGTEIVVLAAQDYFFEDKWRRAYFANFTNMAALDRKSGLRKSLQQAGDLLKQGKTLLIFPEGTRATDGAMRNFKPAIGSLSLEYGVDILPLYLRGTHRALGKGTAILKSRNIGAAIGPPLEVSELQRLTQHLKRTDAYREVARLSQRAVEQLKAGHQLELHRIPTPEGAEQVAEVPEIAPANGSMTKLFNELSTKFVQGSVSEPVSYYFKLGESPDDKWSVSVGTEECVIKTGKPDGRADCVLRTDPEMFTRIVREGYTPSVTEFMSGKVKTNDIELLKTFQRIFKL